MDGCDDYQAAPDTLIGCGHETDDEPLDLLALLGPGCGVVFDAQGRPADILLQRGDAFVHVDDIDTWSTETFGLGWPGERGPRR